MQFKLPDLPFNVAKVSGWLSPETLEFHHDRHHRAYIEKLNSLIKGSKFENESLEEIVKKSDGALFNNAAQAWNHTFYWMGIGPTNLMKDPLKNHLDLRRAIRDSFGSLEQFMNEFFTVATNLFGSGWVWLVMNTDGRRLKIVQTSNADNPMRDGLKPLLVCDVWEHAYYIDYRNARGKYLEGFMKAINWGFVEENLCKHETRELTSIMSAGSDAYENRIITQDFFSEANY
jgi:Fe-Mn family superoxide dismutase